MNLRQATRLLLLLLTVAACGAGVLALAAPWLPPAAETGGPATGGPRFAELVGTGCALAGVGCWAWWALGTAVVAVRALSATGSSSDRWVRWAPRTVRVLVPVLVGAAVTAAPASATTEAGPVTDTAASALAGLPLPDRVATRSPVGRTAVVRTVVVRPGDTLWAVAAGLLPASATTATVDRGWRLIARANADRLGDPDLIHPGTRLRVPPLTVHPREEAP